MDYQKSAMIFIYSKKFIKIEERRIEEFPFQIHSFRGDTENSRSLIISIDLYRKNINNQDY